MYSTLSTVKTWRTPRVPARHLLILETQAKFAALLTSGGVCRLELISHSKFSLPLQPDLPRLIAEAGLITCGSIFVVSSNERSVRFPWRGPSQHQPPNRGLSRESVPTHILPGMLRRDFRNRRGIHHQVTHRLGVNERTHPSRIGSLIWRSTTDVVAPRRRRRMGCRGDTAGCLPG